MVLSRGYGNPWSDMRRLQSEINQLLQSAAAPAASSFPYVNVYASPDAITITAELPGVAEEDLDLMVHRDTLSIRGERKDAGADEAKGYHRRERRVGRFVRTLSLPYAVDPERVEAEMNNGVLRLTLNRPESDKPKRIRVKTS